MSTKSTKNTKELQPDVEGVRKRAREHIESGAVTAGYRGDRQEVIARLNQALATEVVCGLRYRLHYFMAQGLEAKAIAAEFLEHSENERAHADLLARRIVQLNGEPNFNPKGMLERSHSEYVGGAMLVDMIREDLIAERVAIDSYSAMIRYIGDDDPTTRRLLEQILADEENHAEELAALMTARRSVPAN